MDNSNFSCVFIPIFRLFFTQHTQKDLYFTSFSVWIHLYTIPIALFPLFPMLCKLMEFYPPSCGLLVDNFIFSTESIPKRRLNFTHNPKKSLYFTIFFMWTQLYTIPIYFFPQRSDLCKPMGIYPPFPCYTHVHNVENFSVFL